MIIIILSCFIFSVFIIRLIPDRISKFIIYSFTLYWYISLAISTFQPMKYYEVSTKTYLILLLGVLSFIFGFTYLKPKTNTKNIEHNNLLKSIDNILSNKIVIICILFLTIYLFSFAQQTLAASFLSGKAARATGDDTIYIDNTLFSFIYTTVAFPVFHWVMTVMPVCIFNFEKKYILPVIIFILFIISFIIINAGRSSFMIMLLYILIIYYINKNGHIKISFKNVIGLVLLLTIVLSGISAMTNFRDYGTFKMDKQSFTENINDTKERILSYSVLPIVLFDRSLKEDYMNKFDGPLLGKATFAGPELYIGNVIKKYIYPEYKTANDVVISYVQDNYFNISPTSQANFAYTGIFYHYLDFGIIGVVILPFLFGLFFRTIIFSLYQQTNLALLALIGFLYFIMMYSVFSCYLIKPWVTFYIPILLYYGLHR